MTDNETPAAVVYPDLVSKENLAKDWEIAALNACSKARLVIIAKDYNVAILASDVKEQIFSKIYDHMLTEQECTVCESGQCNPTTHLFQPHKEPPENLSQSLHTDTAVSPNTRASRAAAGTSPNSRIRQNDNSADQLLGGGGFTPLYPGQRPPAPANNTQTLANTITLGTELQEALAAGSSTETPEEAEIRIALATDFASFQSELEEVEESNQAKRRAALERAKAKSKGPSLQERIRQQREKQLALMKKKKEERDAAALAQIKRAEQAQKSARPPPSRRSSAPAEGLHTRFNIQDIDEHTFDSPSVHEVLEEEEVFDEPLSKRSLIDYMSGAMVKAMEDMEAKKRRTMSLGAADLGNFNGVPDGAPNTGKLVLKSVGNRFMADRMGLAPPPNLSIEGDLTNLDTQKLHKHMVSGALRKPGQFVQRQMTWPEQCLSANAPGHGKSTFKQLSFPEFVDGFIGKALMETNKDTLDMELANKLCFLREVASMNYTLELPSILSIVYKFLQGYENSQFEWSSWDRIESFMREARFQELCNSVSRSAGPRKQNGGGGGGQAPPQGASNVLGIPTKFYVDNTLCIRYNKGECKEKGSHKHKTQEYMLLHKCAGCLKAGVETEEHGLSNKACPNKPKQPFRQ